MNPPLIIGIAGRSGSGKTTLVHNLLDEYGSSNICLHTMDNYYLPRNQQVVDEDDYLNFDLPDSFYRNRFVQHLNDLINYEEVRLKEYIFNNEREAKTIAIHPAPVIIVEGLFVFHYEEVLNQLDHKVLVSISYEEALKRRLKRDQEERNYIVSEILHRYTKHAEPAFAKFIEPYCEYCDIIVENETDFEAGLGSLHDIIRGKIEG